MPLTLAELDQGIPRQLSGRASGQDVRCADEAGHEPGPRPLVDLAWAAELLHAPMVHDDEAVRHRERLTLVMGHVDERDPHLALDPLELELHGLSELEVQRPERLVEQQRPRPVHQGAGQRHALLLTTRQLPWAALLAALELDQAQHLVDPRIDQPLLELPAAEPERDVVEHRHVWEERIALEDQVDVAPVRRDPHDVVAVQQDPTRRRRLEARDHAQRRRLATAGRPEQREELTAVDPQVDALDRLDVLLRRLVALGDPHHLDRGCAVPVARFCPGVGAGVT